MENKHNCLICGEEVVYTDSAREYECFYCKNSFTANAICKNSHYVCDICHSKPSGEIIASYCLNHGGVSPIEIAQALMRHPSVKMHGPEHHFLIPAALLTGYFNADGRASELPAKLEEAQKRADKVPGGFCGFNGSCGAAIGVGIFVSVATGATPLSGSEWRLANLATSDALREIAERGGPRCCKRNTFTALESAVSFARNHLGADMGQAAHVKCEYSRLNKECRGTKCVYYPA